VAFLWALGAAALAGAGFFAVMQQVLECWMAGASRATMRAPPRARVRRQALVLWGKLA
jgi:hypothetical protein